MNWDAIAAVAETVGVIGVIVSLIYVAVQLKQNTIASNVESKLTMTRLLSDYTDVLFDTSNLNLFMKGRESMQSLQGTDRLRFSNLCLKAFWFYSAAYYQYRKHTIDEDDWFELEAMIDFFVDGAGVRHWWNRHGRTRFSGQFLDYVTTKVARRDAAAG